MTHACMDHWFTVIAAGCELPASLILHQQHDLTTDLMGHAPVQELACRGRRPRACEAVVRACFARYRRWSTALACRMTTRVYGHAQRADAPTSDCAEAVARVQGFPSRSSRICARRACDIAKRCGVTRDSTHYSDVTRGGAGRLQAKALRPAERIGRLASSRVEPDEG